MRALAILLLLVCTSAWSAPVSWQGVDRIVAIGDVHGAYDALITLLQSSGLIDGDGNWSGGSAHLVSLGDLLDRGAESKQVVDLLIALQQQAPGSGGMVHVLLGNHELMNLTNDLRDVSPAEFESYGGIEGHRELFALSGAYGKWLAERPPMLRINATVFVHGGLPAGVAELGIEQTVTTFEDQLYTVLNLGPRLASEGLIAPDADWISAAFDVPDEAGQTDDQAAWIAAAKHELLGANGPLWYRGTAACHALIEQPRLDHALQALNAERVVVGHTPTPSREITRRLNGQAYVIDTGMLAAVYKGNPRALEITAAGLRALGPDGEQTIVPASPEDPTATLTTAGFDSAYESGQGQELTFTDNGLKAEFLAMNERDAQRAVAAFRLDRHLGLNMVPATVMRTIDGRTGIVLAKPGQYMSERSRQEGGYSRPNYCETGSDFHLLAAYDALIGKRDRGLDDLLYNRRDWGIRIVDNHTAFSSQSRLPTYTQTPTLAPLLAERLRALNADVLETLLQDLVSPRTQRAILKRRDAILTWPRA